LCTASFGGRKITKISTRVARKGGLQPCGGFEDKAFNREVHEVNREASRGRLVFAIFALSLHILCG
jgi:hypothetical protein